MEQFSSYEEKFSCHIYHNKLSERARDNIERNVGDNNGTKESVCSLSEKFAWKNKLEPEFLKYFMQLFS